MKMPKRYRGTVRNGVVVLEPEARLPEGTEVEVVERVSEFQPDWQVAWQSVGIGRDREGHTDVSEQVDKFLIQAYSQETQ
ncbi:MAG: hypothetical protein N2554_11365 [Fimbriimonadales bacterium]|nr:hypothetical protein [Fimbriimonadales bacterium]